MVAGQNRVVFLDRDGVLVRTYVREGVPHPPDGIEELEVLPGVAESLARLVDAGLTLIVVTNQPDVARGRQTRAAVESMNRLLEQQLPLDATIVCYHDTVDDCTCRKPKPGMIVEGASRCGASLTDSFMVGDRWSDIVAGAAAGCRTLLIEAPYSQPQKCNPDYIVADLPAATDIILQLL